jgi:hypothetical protein
LGGTVENLCIVRAPSTAEGIESKQSWQGEISGIGIVKLPPTLGMITTPVPGSVTGRERLGKFHGSLEALGRILFQTFENNTI